MALFLKEGQTRLMEQPLLMRWSHTLSKTLLSVAGKQEKNSIRCGSVDGHWAHATVWEISITSLYMARATSLMLFPSLFRFPVSVLSVFSIPLHIAIICQTIDELVEFEHLELACLFF